jgi:hypothetical protein
MTEQTPIEASKADSSKTKKPFYQRPWFIVLAVLVLISSISNAVDKNDNTASEPQATVTVTATPTPSETPIAEETQAEVSPSPEETVNVDSDFNILNFKSSAQGNIDDLKKDLTDLRKRAEEGSLFRLLGNVLEISFNQGQLEALTDVPTKIARTWPAQMVKLATAIDALSDKTSAYVGGDASLSSLKDSINKVNGIADNLAALAGKL